MMISPERYIEMIEDKSFENLIKERDCLIAEIRKFEKSIYKTKANAWQISPSPDVVYQCKLMYLAKLCEVIATTYNRVYVWGRDI